MSVSYVQHRALIRAKYLLALLTAFPNNPPALQSLVCRRVFPSTHRQTIAKMEET